MEMKKSRKIILTIIGIIVAVYTLFPFYLVVMNTFKNANNIVADPVGFGGVSVSQLMSNLSAVVNNSNCNGEIFWQTAGKSAERQVPGDAGTVRRHGSMGDLPQQDQMVHRDLYDLYCIDDHSVPGSYAASDLYFP